MIRDLRRVGLQLKQALKDLDSQNVPRSTLVATLQLHRELVSAQKEVSPALLAKIDRAVLSASIAHELPTLSPLLLETVIRPCALLRAYPPGCLAAWSSGSSVAEWPIAHIRIILPLVTEGVSCNEVSGACSAIISSSCRVLRVQACQHIDKLQGTAKFQAGDMHVLVDACRLAVRAALVVPGGLASGSPLTDDVCGILHGRTRRRDSESSLTRLRNGAILGQGWSLVQVVLGDVDAGEQRGDRGVPIRGALRGMGMHWRVPFAETKRPSVDASDSELSVRSAVLDALTRASAASTQLNGLSSK